MHSCRGGEEGLNENSKDVGRRKARFALSRCLAGNRKERKPKTRLELLVLGLCLIASHWLCHVPVWLLCGTDAKVGLEMQAFIWGGGRQAQAGRAENGVGFAPQPRPEKAV